MDTIPDNLQYTKTHEWIHLESNGNIKVGITQHAQHLLGDIIFVELPATNTTVQAGKEIVVVESVKAAADVYAPLAGTIVKVNEALQTQPELINQDPYKQGWLFELKPTDPAAGMFLTADEYAHQLQSSS